MSQIYTGNLRKADIHHNTSGDNAIIAAPGVGKHIVIDFITLIPTAAVTVQMKDGDTNYGGAFPLDAKQPFTFENTLHQDCGIITLGDNKAFNINLNGAVYVDGFVRYRVIGE